MSITPFFSGEIQLAGWNEAHNSGCKITFWVPDPADLDVFRAATVRKGNHAGQRFACVLVEIGDDEQIIQQIKPDKPKGGELARWAGIFSNDPVFWEFLTEFYGYEYDIWDAAKAADAIRTETGVESRAQLDHNPVAAKQFRYMMGKFHDWTNGGKAA